MIKKTKKMVNKGMKTKYDRWKKLKDDEIEKQF
jgi:hypothetical protein